MNKIIGLALSTLVLSSLLSSPALAALNQRKPVEIEGVFATYVPNFDGTITIMGADDEKGKYPPRIMDDGELVYIMGDADTLCYMLGFGWHSGVNVREKALEKTAFGQIAQRVKTFSRRQQIRTVEEGRWPNKETNKYALYAERITCRLQE